MGTKLEMRADRNRHADFSLQRDNFFLRSLLAPYFPVAGEDIPDFIHRAMHDRVGHPSRREFEVRHTAAPGPQQHANVRPIRSNNIGPKR